MRTALFYFFVVEYFDPIIETSTKNNRKYIFICIISLISLLVSATDFETDYLIRICDKLIETGNIYICERQQRIDNLINNLNRRQHSCKNKCILYKKNIRSIPPLHIWSGNCLSKPVHNNRGATGRLQLRNRCKVKNFLSSRVNRTLHFTKIRMKTISDRNAYQQNRYIFRQRLFLCRWKSVSPMPSTKQNHRNSFLSKQYATESIYGDTYKDTIWIVTVSSYVFIQQKFCFSNIYSIFGILLLWWLHTVRFIRTGLMCLFLLPETEYIKQNNN